MSNGSGLLVDYRVFLFSIVSLAEVSNQSLQDTMSLLSVLLCVLPPQRIHWSILGPVLDVRAMFRHHSSRE
jgi:hypothetical protein